MLCERYKTALIEAAARGRGVESLAPAVRAHLGACGECLKVLATEQMLQAAITESIHARVRGDVPASLSAAVRGRVAKETATLGKVHWQWAAIAAAIAIAFGVATFHDWSQRNGTNSGVAVQAVSRPGDLPGPVDSQGATRPKNNGDRVRTSTNQRPTFVEVAQESKPLVSLEQRAAMEQLVRNIQQGEIDAAVLQWEVQPAKTGNVQIAPIQLQAMGVTAIGTDPGTAILDTTR